MPVNVQVANQKQKNALLLATISAFRWPIISAVFPRLCLLGFTFAQPFLIHQTVTFVAQPLTEESQDAGYGLIGAFAFVFIGIAVSTSALNVGPTIC
jgi:ATP-binding cassette subfamily C (CFTR/MRP) protein 1